MRGTLAILITLTMACGGTPGGDGEGPRVGYWQVGGFDLFPGGWVCTSPIDDETCMPPAYFSPLPDEVRIGGGGVVAWVGADEHRGATDEMCIHVPAASEHGVERAAYDFCRITIDDMPSDDHAHVTIAWNPGTADECWCTSFLTYAGE